MKNLLIAVVMLSTFALAQNDMEEMSISMSDVPANVRGAAIAIANARGLSIQGVQVEVEDDGMLYYEFDAGEGYEIDITADGKMDEIEEEIELSEAPQAVRNAVRNFLGDFEPTTVEISHRAYGEMVYEMEGKLNGQEVDIEIDANGRSITISQD